LKLFENVTGVWFFEPHCSYYSYLDSVVVFLLLTHLLYVRYGFRSKPELVLFAKPWVGAREVNLSPLTDWIEKKLAVEFQV